MLPANPFDARLDAEQLYEAMDGLGTDESQIIKILAHRDSNQRQKIAIEYKTMYGNVIALLYL